MHNKKRNNLCKEIAKAISKAQRFVEGIRHDPDNATHFSIDAYAKRTLDLFNCSNACLRTKSYSSIPILLRAALESYAIVVNLVVDKSFIWVLELHQLKEKQNMIKRAKSLDELETETQSKEYLDFDRQVNETIKLYNICIIDGKIDVFKDYKSKMERVKMRFQNAQLNHLHDVGYFLLCQDAHSNMLSIEKLQLTAKQKEWKFHLSSRFTSNVYLYFAAILDLVHGIPKRMHEYFNQGDSKELEQLKSFCESIKSNYHFYGQLDKDDEVGELEGNSPMEEHD